MLVEALDLLPTELVHQGLEDRVGSQDRERGEPLVLGGSPGHVVGQPQEPARVGHRKRSHLDVEPEMGRSFPSQAGAPRCLDTPSRKAMST
jgi:hypothetical protein